MSFYHPKILKNQQDQCENGTGLKQNTSLFQLSSQLNNKLKLYKDRVEKASQDRAMSARSTPMVM